MTDRRVAVGILALFLFGAAPAAAQTVGPHLVFEREHIDLGEVRDGVPVRVAFVMRNEGDAPLQISDLETSCGCTAALSSAATLAPGKTGEIVVTLDPRRTLDRPTKTITVRTNDPDRPAIFLKLTADVQHAVELGTRVVNFGTVQLGEEREAPLVVFYDPAAPVKITEVTASSPLLSFTVTHQESDVDRPAYVITVRLARGASPGVFADTVRIHLDHEQYDVFEVPVRAQIAGSVRTTPAVLGLGMMRPDRRADRTVTVTAPSLRHFRVERVESTSPHIVPSVQPGAPGEYQVGVHLGPEAPRGSLQATLRIYTNARDMPLVEVPVAVIVR